MPYRIKHILLITCLAWHASSSFGQYENISFERISGIPQCDVENVIEDHYGFLWFATCEGLFLYDGYEFKAFRHDVTDSSSISNPYVHSIFEDLEGNIWAGTAVGLNLLDRRTGKFQLFKPNPGDKTKVNNHVHWIFEDSRKNLWVNSNENMFLFNRKTRQFYKLYQKGNPEQTHNVREIIEDNRGTIWAGTNLGLLKVNEGNSTFLHVLPHPDPQSAFNKTIRYILPEPDNTFLLATQGGLLKWNPETHEIIENFLPSEFKHFQVNFLTKDMAGNYWISFSKKGMGVYATGQSEFHYYTHKPNQLNSLNNDEVACILEDRFRNIWVCTAGGICKIQIDNSGFGLYQNFPGINHISNQAIRVLKAGNGAIWSVTPEGIFVLEKGKTESRNVEIVRDKVDYRAGSFLYEDQDGSIWVTIDGKGIHRRANGSPAFRRLQLGDTLAKATIYKIIKDASDDDYLWLGTSFGLCRLHRKSFKREWYIPSRDIPDAASDKVSIFEQLGKDEIWMYFTYYNSLGRFDKKSGRFEQFRPPPEEKAVLEGAIKDIAISDDGIVWLATLYGLTFFDTRTKKFGIYTKKDGLDENVLNTAILDKNGKIWLCGNRFLSRFDPLGKTFKNYQVGREVKNFYSKSKYLAPDGTILLGSLNGIYTFHPDEVTENQELPNIVLTDFKVKGKTYLLKEPFENTKKIILSYDENDITFEFPAIHYINPGANRYRCRLEGFDASWRELGNEHKATYTNLNHGNYVFRVMASNSDGVWNEKGLSIELFIAPAFWQTIWFRALILLMVLSIVYAIIKTRQHQIALKRQKVMAEQSAEFKTRFLAEVSHEIRTPMNAIIGLSKLIKGPNLHQKQENFINAIQQSSTNLLTIINDLLDHTKLEAGKFTLVTKPFDLREVVGQLKEILQHKAEEKQLGFELIMNPDVHPHLLGDPVRLNQILINLLGNAIKFTKHGKVWLHIEKLSESGQNTTMRFEVGDTGIGIPEQQLDSIFENFSQAGNENNYATEGTGLGLSIARQLVEIQGGQLLIESEPGKGTKLWFDLTFEKSAPVQKQQLSDSGRLVIEALKVLVVEDTDFNQMVAVEILEEHIGKAEIAIAENGKAALEKLETESFDLILMDVKMPVMNGYEAAKAIRRMEDETRRKTPIIAVTANALPEQLQKCREAGMDDVVTKPIDEEELVRKMYLLVKGKESIDREKLKKLMGNSEKRAKQYLEIFKSQTPGQLTQLKGAVTRNEWEQVSITAHTLKNQCRYLSLEELGELASNIERLAEDKEELASIPGLVTRLDAGLSSVLEKEAG